MATITGSDGNDVLTGTADADQIFALAGDDRLVGSLGTDLLDGGEGSDTVDYGQFPASVQVQLDTQSVGKGTGGTDTLVSIGNAIGSAFGDSLWGNGNANRLQGGDGNDGLYGGAGDDVLDGGGGSNHVLYGGAPAGAIVDLSSGRALDGFGSIDQLIGIASASGGDHGDILQGSDDANTLRGSGGNDQLLGRGGDDVLSGGRGNDILDGGSGTDTVDYLSDAGGGGITADLAARSGDDGSGGRDLLNGIENVTGTADFADIIKGDDAPNRIAALGGANMLTGRGGADVFDMSNWDWWGRTTVMDFEAGQDKLFVDLHSIPMQFPPAGPLDPSHFTTGDRTEPEQWFAYDRTSGRVTFDTDGSGPSDDMLVVTLANHPDLSAADILV